MIRRNALSPEYSKDNKFMTKFEAALILFKDNTNLFTWDSVRGLPHKYAKDIMTNEFNAYNKEGGLDLVDYMVSSLDHCNCFYGSGPYPVYIDSKTQASFIRMVNVVIKRSES